MWRYRIRRSVFSFPSPYFQWIPWKRSMACAYQVKVISVSTSQLSLPTQLCFSPSVSQLSDIFLLTEISRILTEFMKFSYEIIFNYFMGFQRPPSEISLLWKPHVHHVCCFIIRWTGFSLKCWCNIIKWSKNWTAVSSRDNLNMSFLDVLDPTILFVELIFLNLHKI
jgi:hypothetical protein